MLSCKESTHLLSEGLDRSLGTGERITLEMHLLICKGCRNYRQQMDFLRVACKSFAKRAENGHNKDERTSE